MVHQVPLVPQALKIFIDLERDKLEKFGQATKFLPHPQPSPSTFWRWRTKGVNGIKLPAVKCGNTWMTTRQAVIEFIRLQTLAAQPAAFEPEGRSPETIRELKEAGLL